MQLPNIPRLALLITVASALLIGCQNNQEIKKSSKPLAVKTISMQPQNEFLWIETVGKAEGIRQAEVRPQVTGILERITYKEGAHVKQGDVLFEIDPSSYRANYEAARATSLQMKALVEQNKREADRYSKLSEMGASSQKLADDAKSAYAVSLANYKVAQAQETSARIELERTKVRAPSNGIVSLAAVNPGSLLTANTSLLATITQPDELRVTFSASERDVGQNQISESNHVRFLINGQTINARLDYIAKELDPLSATRTMRACLEAPNAALSAGQMVRVQLQTQELHNVYRVPQAAINQQPDGTYALYLLQNNTAVMKTVKVGRWVDSDWIVLDGLNPGDEVIVNHIQRLRNGLSVTKIIDSSQVKNSSTVTP